MNAVKEDVEKLVQKELEYANQKFPMFRSDHEGYAVIKEEIEESEQALENTKVYSLAEYSTADKAKKAMQKLHECYTGVLLMQNVSLPEDEAEQLKNMTSGFICMNSREDNVRIEPMHMVFRFPQEDEI